MNGSDHRSLGGFHTSKQNLPDSRPFLGTFPTSPDVSKSFCSHASCLELQLTCRFQKITRCQLLLVIHFTGIRGNAITNILTKNSWDKGFLCPPFDIEQLLTALKHYICFKSWAAHSSGSRFGRPSVSKIWRQKSMVYRCV